MPGTAALCPSHVGLCVPDVARATAWYCDVFSFRLLRAPFEISVDDAMHGEVVADVFGPEFAVARMSHLLMGGGVGLELFEFVQPRVVERELSYWEQGFSHLCLVAEDLEGTVRRVLAAGGRQRSRVWGEAGTSPSRFVHLEDPFGTLLELHSHRYDVAVGLNG